MGRGNAASATRQACAAPSSGPAASLPLASEHQQTQSRLTVQEIIEAIPVKTLTVSVRGRGSQPVRQACLTPRRADPPQAEGWSRACL